MYTLSWLLWGIMSVTSKPASLAKLARNTYRLMEASESHSAIPFVIKTLFTQSSKFNKVRNANRQSEIKPQIPIANRRCF